MRIETFKHEFKQRNGVMLTDNIMLFRKPLELYDMAKDKTLATFKGKNVDVVLPFEIDGKTVQQIIESWTEMPTIALNGGRGGGSGMGNFNQKWPSSGNGNEKDRTTSDHPARMNVKAGVNRTYEDMLKAFADTHADSDIEHGVTIDGYGYTTRYRHGNSGSIGIWGSKGEIVVHNHPAGGWPNFSKEDLLSVASSGERGIVAVSGTKGRSAETAKYAGTYSFVKGTHFNATAFTKAINNATIRGNDYNDAVSKWLKANQKKYGYKYSYSK